MGGFQYPDIYFEESLSSGSRLTIGPKSKHINLIDELAKTWKTGPYYVLYVSLLSQTGKESGRYQSPLINDFEDFRLFLYTFQNFFENDGRHHIWFVSPDNGMLIYDQHNVIFAYGNLDNYREVLAKNEIKEKEFWFPSPHTHNYPTEHIEYEDELFDYWEWQHFPLEDGDEY